MECYINSGHYSSPKAEQLTLLESTLLHEILMSKAVAWPTASQFLPQMLFFFLILNYLEVRAT